MGDMIKMPTSDISNLTAEDFRQLAQQMAGAMSTMADMLRATNESMEQLRRQVRLLEKVTPAQCSAINAAIRERAATLCVDYRLPGQEKAVAAAIRKAIKLQFGAATVRELPRCDYDVAQEQVGMWEDYKAIKAIKGRMQK